MKKLLAVLVASGLGLAAYAWAQISVPQVTVINPTDLIQVIPGGQPSAGNRYAVPSQLTSQSGYYKNTFIVSCATWKCGGLASTYTYTFANNQTFAMFSNASAATYLYVNFAPGPSDGARECIYSKGGVTTAYLAANTSQTLNDAVTALTAATQYCYVYGASNATWDRSQ